MKALFMETEAAAQCLRYAKANKWDDADTQDLLDRCYARGVERRIGSKVPFDDFLVSSCLKGDSHKNLTVDTIFTWEGTPEGHEYWHSINVY